MKRLFMACILAVICFSFSGSVFATATNNDKKTAIDATFTIELPKENQEKVEEKTSKEQASPKKAKADGKASKKQAAPEKEKAENKASKKQGASEKVKADGKASKKQASPEKVKVEDKASKKQTSSEKAKVEDKASKKQGAPEKAKAEEKQKASKEQAVPEKAKAAEKQKRAKRQSSIRIALVLQNSINDMAESQAMYEGVNSVKEYYTYLNKSTQKKMPPIKITVIERRKNTTKATSSIRKYAKKGFDLIIVQGAQYEKILDTIAPNYPKTSFAYGSGSVTKHPNIFAYDIQAQEGGYLLGMLAGFLTKSNTIAIVDSAKKGNTANFNQGFVKGVKATNGKAEVHIAKANSTKNKTSMKKAVKKYILMGADIISSSGQQSSTAIKAVADSSKVLWLGSPGTNPVKLAPKTVVAAQIYDFSQAINAMLTFRSKNILGGKTIPLSLANGYEYIQYNQGIRSDYMKALNKAKEAIKNGSLSVAPIEKQMSPKKPTEKPMGKQSGEKSASGKSASGKSADKPTTKK